MVIAWIVADIRELKDKMSKLNYNEEKLAVLYGKETNGREYDKILRKAIQQGWVKYNVRPLKHV